jgi:hypothetical protein
LLHAQIFLEAWGHRLRRIRRFDSSFSSALMGIPLVSYTPSLRELTAIHHAAQLPFFVPARFNAHIGCRNINLLPITYASRPRLRIRLTPGGLTWPGKPWVFGDGVSHSVYRYSSWHNLLLTLQLSFRSTFTASTMLSYRMQIHVVFTYPKLRCPA